MNLIEQINADFIAAFKASKGNEVKKAEKDFLGLLKSDFTKESKTPDNAFIVSKIKAMIKNAEIKNAQGEATGEMSLTEAELTILNGYLPTQLNEEQLTELLKTEAEDKGYKLMSDMGKMMSFLKNNYGGQYDGKMASTLVRTLLK